MLVTSNTHKVQTSSTHCHSNRQNLYLRLSGAEERGSAFPGTRAFWRAPDSPGPALLESHVSALARAG